MKFRPLQDWAVIKQIDAKEKTRGGIIIPDTAKEKPSEGIIVSIGPGKYKTGKAEGKDKKKKFEATTLKPGQRVIYTGYMASEIELDGEEITLVREEDILGTVEETSQLTARESHDISKKPAQPLIVKKKSEVAQPLIKEKVPHGKKIKKKAAKKTTGKTTPDKAVKEKPPGEKLKKDS
ncbi:10 kDa chaperonin 2 [bacterium BMS3Abin07]|nr:10 kDa chaperonin 2 [bacterium BMS3Abin07]GBE32343.1 10 kDa chaperonin 2 [bacterium BMS3Bbin05]HDO21706.1 co-chaperone GroES [Nitrospirota bacterium]HDZ87657.1 co-chaperone GroES [Nitrospirota bacterium]